MSTVQATLRCQLHPAESLPGIVSSINRLLQRSTDGRSYATFFLAEFDRATRHLTYVNAGHNPPILTASSLATDPDIRLLTIGGPIIGAFLDQSYEQEEVLLKSGDMLLVYTDGVTEALSPAGVEFGEERLRSTFMEAKSLGTRQAAET